MSEGSGAVSEVVAKTEQELSRFWSVPDTSTGREIAKVRASTMNYAVVTTPAELPRLREELMTLAEVRAGRFFLLTLDAHLAPWELSSEVSATCRKEGDDVICHDRVEMSFGAIAASRAASVLSALSLDEVPMIVELGRGAPGPLVDALARAADRLVVDSAATDVVKLAEALKKSKASVADRAMVRSYSWRDLLARCFDAVPSATGAVERVVIARTKGGAQEPASLFFGWLASRLGWTFASHREAKDAHERPVVLEINDAEREGLGPGEIVSIELDSKIDEKSLVARVARGADARTAVWSLSGARTVEHGHAIGFRDEAWVLSKALDPSTFDAVARQALLAAATWSAA